MFPLNRNELENLDENNFELLCRLDGEGLFFRENEKFIDYKQRLLNEFDALQKMADDLDKNGELIFFDSFKVPQSAAIDLSIIQEAYQTNSDLYQFKMDYVPGFFLSSEVGRLWGGCSLYDDETQIRVFLLRGDFKKQPHWFVYDRNEILAHELCHAARQTLQDPLFEEYFAYQTSKNHFRRYMGGFFIHDFDAMLFILPTLIMLAAQIVQSFIWGKLPIWPFWLLTVCGIGFLGVRNEFIRLTVRKAKRRLQKFDVKFPEAFLFRCNKNTIKEIGKISCKNDFDQYIDDKSKNNLHWKILKAKFC